MCAELLIATQRFERCLATLVILLAILSSACTLQVDSTADAPDANPGDGECARAAPPRPDGQGLCTLRAAIMESNATFGAERIEIPSGVYSLTLPANEGGGPLVIDRSVAIRGAGTGVTIIDAEATQFDPALGCPASGPERRVFTINAGIVSIRYATIRGGFAQHGAGIRVNGGEVEITDASIQRNGAFTGGGGIYAAGGVTRIRRTSLLENCANGAFGGGLRLSAAAQVWVYESLIANNRANRAGGVYNLGQLNLRSTTVSGNTVDSSEAGTGGVSQNNFAVFSNVTITNNTGRGDNVGSFLGGGLATSAGAISVVRNSIIAGNDGAGGPNDCAGSLSGDSRYSLIGDSDGCTIPSNLNTFILDVDPLLGPLTSHGGPTQTHALLTGSPARETGYEFPPPAIYACEPHDQRGVPRPQVGECDMGAFEAGNASAFISSFILVDAASNTDLFPIRNGELLILDLLPAQLSIRVNVSPVPGSVQFAFDGNPNFQIENAAPYALDGDSMGGDYLPVAFEPGQHTIRATPFSGENATGAAGGSRELQFAVIGEPPAD